MRIPLLDSAGLPGVIGFGLLLFCLSFYFGNVASLQDELASLLDKRARLEAAAEAGRRGNGARVAVSAMPALINPPELIKKLDALALTNGVAVETSSYRMTSGNGPRRLEVGMPLKIAYPQLRAYLRDALSLSPTASLDELRLQRTSVGEPTIDAQLRLSFDAAPRIDQSAMGSRSPSAEWSSSVVKEATASSTDSLLPVAPIPSTVKIEVAATGTTVTGVTHDAAPVPATQEVLSHSISTGSAPSDSVVDIFAIRSWEPQPPPRATPVVLVPPPPPQLPFRFLGKIEVPGQPAAFMLADGERVIVVGVGDVIGADYRVEQYDKGQLHFLFRPMSVRQSLAVGNAS